jgi:hypothetical protein
VFQGRKLICVVKDCRLTTPGEISPNPGTSPPRVPPRTGGAVAKAQFNNVEDVLAAVPMDLLPPTRQDWFDKDLNKRFAQAFIAAFRDKPAVCRLTIAQVVPPGAGGRSFLVISQPFPLGSTKLTIEMLLPVEDPRLPALKPGLTCTVSGLINPGSWGPSGLSVSFHEAPIVLR